jgi:hypothetical protein
LKKLVADVGFEPTSCNLEDCRSRSAELIGWKIIIISNLKNTSTVMVFQSLLFMDFMLVVGVGIAPTCSAFQTDAHLSKPSNRKIERD